MYSDAAADAIWKRVSSFLARSLSVLPFRVDNLYGNMNTQKNTISGIAQSHSMCVFIRLDYFDSTSTLLYPLLAPSLPLPQVQMHNA